MKTVMRSSVIIVLAVVMVLAAAILPQNEVSAKAKPWYGKYWELKKTAKKSVKIKGKKVYLRGKWENSAKKAQGVKPKKIKKTFKLTKKTKYYLTWTDEDKPKKVSKKKFKKYLYSDVTYCSFKVKKGKVVKACLDFN